MFIVEGGHEAVVGALLEAGADKATTDEVRGGTVQGESGAVRSSSYWFRFERNDASRFVSS